MPTVATFGLRNKSTHVMHVPLSTTRLITIPVSTPEADLTRVELNQTEKDAWDKAAVTPPVQDWLASGELTVKTIRDAAPPPAEPPPAEPPP
jgi:hypothetical protein